jgi:hypothetical protein
MVSSRNGKNVQREAAGESNHALSLKAAAKMMGVSPARLRKLIHRGEGPPFIVIGRDKVFREKTLELWLAKREKESLKILKQKRQFVDKFSGSHT